MKCNIKNIQRKRTDNHEARESLIEFRCFDCGFEYETTTDWDSGNQLDEEEEVMKDFNAKHASHLKAMPVPAEILKQQVKEIEGRVEVKKETKQSEQTKQINLNALVLMDSTINPDDIYIEGFDGFLKKQSFELPSIVVRGNARGFSKSKKKTKLVQKTKYSSTVLWLEKNVRIENPIIQRVFYFETTRRRDKDNFDISTKPIIDGMQSAQVFKDDSEVVFLPTLFRKGKNRVEILLFKAVPPVMLFK